MPNTSYYFGQPALTFEEAFPLGNGFTGVMLYGGRETETLSVNCDTLWSGHPSVCHAPENAPEVWKRARELTRVGRYAEAQDLLIGGFSGHATQKYMAAGTIRIAFDAPSEGTYRRALDLRTSTAVVTEENRIRTCYLPYRENAIVYRIVGKGKPVDFTLSFDTELRRLAANISGDTLFVEAVCPAEVDTAIQWRGKECYRYSEKPGDAVHFAAAIRVETDGTVNGSGDALSVSGGTYATIRAFFRTSFIDAFTPPTADCAAEVLKAAKAPFDEDAVYAAHVSDVSSLFNRVFFSLGGEEVDLDNNERMRRFDGTDRGLYELLFHFSRYLMIAGSRPGSQVMNLQGIWSEGINPPWNANYTVNINTEMNYWPAFSCNLAECFEPMRGFMHRMAESGRNTAKEFYGDPGFVCHHNTDLWGHTAPVSGAEGSSAWAHWPMGSGWLCCQLYDAYTYTLDRDYLEDILPLLTEACRFYRSQLTPLEDGRLVLSPASSPENRFFPGEDSSVSCTHGVYAAMTQSILGELFRDTAAACDVLDAEHELRDELLMIRDRLQKPVIGEDGRLLEWDKPYREAEVNHRHLSHLIGLYPLREISPVRDKELTDACRKSLIVRGDEGTGWSLGWKINLWAVLGDGDHARKLLDRQLCVRYHAEEYNYVDGGGTYPNLFDAHPPFQIDGNFGAGAGIANMLLRDDADGLHILPALPAAWEESGSFSGLCARGGLTVGAAWSRGLVTHLTVTAPAGASVHLIVNGKALSAIADGNGTIDIDFR